MKNSKNALIGIIGFVFIVSLLTYFLGRNGRTEDTFQVDPYTRANKRRIDSTYEAERIAAHKLQDSIDKSPYGIQLKKEEAKNRAKEELENKKKEVEYKKLSKIAEKIGCSPEDAQRVLDGEIWLGMTYEMVIYQRGKPNVLNLSNYGQGDNYQACWEGYTPFCFYFKASDHIIYAYN
jgi:hypothetical protein